MDSYIDLNYVLSDNFSFSDVPELELSCSESEVEGNCNQNARTHRSANSSGAATPKENVETEEALAELEKELQIDTKYPLDTVKPCLLGILGHSRKDYIVELLRSRESTIYKYDITDAGDTTVWVPAQVMARVIVQNKFTVEKHKEEEILCPSKIDVVNEAFEYIKNLEKNKAAKSLLEAFPYYPLQHDLPILEYVKPANFHDWKAPAPPTQADWRVFRYAPTNFRLGKTSYAANCRHPVRAWDEHPWCGLCLVKADITICPAPEKDKKSKATAEEQEATAPVPTQPPCYLCARMTKRQIRKYIESFNSWKSKYAEDPATTQKSRKILEVVENQWHADWANYTNDDMNPAWKSTKRYGFCRPSWACPFYFTTVELEAEAVAKLVKRATDQQDIGYAVYDTYGGRDPLHHGWPALNTLAERKRAQSNQNPPPEPSEEEGSEEMEEDDDVIITKLLGKGKASSARPRKKTQGQEK